MTADQDLVDILIEAVAIEVQRVERYEALLARLRGGGG